MDDVKTKRPRGRPFTGRDDPRNGGGRPRGKRQPDLALLLDWDDDPDAPFYLRFLRSVLVRGPSRDDTPGQRALRRVMEDHPKQFLDLLERAERMCLSRKAGEVERAGTQDVGAAVEESERVECAVTGKVVESMEQWLARHRAAAE